MDYQAMYQQKLTTAEEAGFVKRTFAIRFSTCS